MLTSHSPGGRGHRAILVAFGVAVMGAFATHEAQAHFRLVSPPNFVVQTMPNADPQKVGPCGNEAPQTPTNMVTTYRPGQTISVQIVETVDHPGHYRVALANTQAQLPADPPVTKVGNDECGSTVVQANPTLPVLVDGALKHTASFNKVQQTISVTLPNTTCTNCVLQVIEYMSSHGAPCFYHHCAIISIQGTPVDGGAGSDAGAVDAGRDVSSGAGGSSGGGGTAGSTGGTMGGAAGAATGGAGGDTGAGGSAGSGTSGPGGSSSTGGSSASTTSAATGGSGGSTSSGASGGSGGSTTKPPSGDDTGCACSVPGRSAKSWASIAGLAALALATGGRRRRRTGARPLA